MAELQHSVTEALMDTSLFPHLAEDISPDIVYLYCEILQLRESNTMLLSWDHYLQVASDVGLEADEDVQKATMLLECKVCNGKLKCLTHSKPSPSAVQESNFRKRYL